MAYFITRVELHNAKTWAEYDRLHEAMESQGFTRTIGTNAGTKALPTAEYYHVDGFSSAMILAKAQRAAATTGRNAGFLVSHVADGLVDGLNPA